MFLLLGGQGGLLSSHFLVPPASKMVTTVKSVVQCVETVETVKTVETYVGSTNGWPPAVGGFDVGFDSFDSFNSFDICFYGLDGRCTQIPENMRRMRTPTCTRMPGHPRMLLGRDAPTPTLTPLRPCTPSGPPRRQWSKPLTFAPSTVGPSPPPAQRRPP